jgi:hypothetical protein
VKAKNVLSIIAVVSAGTAAVLTAKNYIKLRAARQKNSLGIDWKYLNDSPGPTQFVKRKATELRLGCQRFARGYDYSQFRNFRGHLDDLIIEQLRWLIKNRHGSPDIADDMTDDEIFRSKDSRYIIQYDENDEEDNSVHEKFTAILKEMLFHFEQSKDEYCLEENEFLDSADFDFNSPKDVKDNTAAPDAPDEVYEFNNMFADQSKEAVTIRKRCLYREREIERYQYEHHKKALAMLAKYYIYLWD